LSRHAGRLLEGSAVPCFAIRLFFGFLLFRLAFDGIIGSSLGGTLFRLLASLREG